MHHPSLLQPLPLLGSVFGLDESATAGVESGRARRREGKEGKTHCPMAQIERAMDQSGGEEEEEDTKQMASATYWT